MYFLQADWFIDTTMARQRALQVDRKCMFASTWALLFQMLIFFFFWRATLSLLPSDPQAFFALQNFLETCDVVLNDVCFFISEEGLMYGELSQDCGRFRHYDLGNLDKGKMKENERKIN